MREGDEYLDELKNSINLPVHSRSRDIRRALSWRYASCGRRGMLILCDAFITRARPGVFYFHEVLRPVNIFDGSKVEEIFLTADRAMRDPITWESVETNRQLLPMHIISF